MKIHIIGGSGTGKSYISKKLSTSLTIPHYDLDNIFWDNTAITYGKKTSPNIRSTMLLDILKNDNWIIEGVYYSWLENSFKDADYIFILNCPSITYKYRIISRFIKRKLGIEKGKKETFNSLIKLLKWTDNYQKHELKNIINFLQPYKQKVIFIKNSKEIFKIIKKHERK